MIRARDLVGPVMAAFRELWEAEETLMMGDRVSFPGAVGRSGTQLVRLGLANRLGRCVYAGNRPEMGERPDAYVRFELTVKGRRIAKRWFQEKKHAPEL